MKTLEYSFIDKTGWPQGPWMTEPDKVQFPDANTGLACLIKRNHYGVWCGYVGVDPEHSWFKRDYTEVDAGVHGGLTYSDLCDGDGEHGICHVPESGEPEPLWWFGFDCGHGWDYAPGMEAMEREIRGRHPDLGTIPWTRGTYKDRHFVENEVASLAQQLARVS